VTSMSRSKRIATAAGLLAVGLVLAACSTGGGSTPTATPSKSAAIDFSKPVQLTYVAYGGAGQQVQTDSWQKPYTALHPNVTFNNTSPADPAQVKAQVTAGQILWNVTAVAPYAAAQNCGTLFEKLDTSALNKKDYPPNSIGDCYVDNFINAPIMAYNPADFPGGVGPKTIADFFNTTKFPGKRGVVSDLQNGLLEYGELGAGVKPSKVYPINMDKALAPWTKIKDQTIFAPNVGALQQAVASNQVSAWFLVSSRQLALLQSGMKIVPVWDKTVTAANALAIPKGAANKDIAEDFIRFVAQPEQQATEAENGGVTAINLKAKPTLSPDAKLVDPISNQKPADLVSQDVTYYAKNFNQLTVQLTNWLAG